MRVVVIGGTRFIGRATVEELVDAGHSPLVVHRGVSEPADLPNVPHLHVDRSELPRAAAKLRDFEPDAAVDTYAMTAADAGAALEALPDIPLVVLSSADVYRAWASLDAGERTDAVPIDEDAPVRADRYPYRGADPADAGYADPDNYEKLDVEERYLERRAAVLRLPFVYGEHDPRRREEFVLRRVRSGDRRIPVGPGRWLASRVYVRDVARAVRLTLETGAAAGRVLNLAERSTWPVSEWVERILRAADWSAELAEVPEEELPADMEFTRSWSQDLLLDSTRARELLGWEDTDPGEALRRSVRWHLANPPAASKAD
jgi:nucleoside-diphosphate-sugar epimerase